MPITFRRDKLADLKASPIDFLEYEGNLYVAGKEVIDQLIALGFEHRPKASNHKPDPKHLYAGLRRQLTDVYVVKNVDHYIATKLACERYNALPDTKLDCKIEEFIYNLIEESFNAGQQSNPKPTVVIPSAPVTSTVIPDDLVGPEPTSSSSRIVESSRGPGEPGTD